MDESARYPHREGRAAQAATQSAGKTPLKSSRGIAGSAEAERKHAGLRLSIRSEHDAVFRSISGRLLSRGVRRNCVYMHQLVMPMAV